MRTIILIMYLVSLNSLYSQEVMEDSIQAKQLIKDLKFKESEVRKLSKIYADSINTWGNDAPCPSFLLDSEFDLKFAHLWPSKAFPISMRKFILEQVSNTLAMSLILSTYAKAMKKHKSSKYFDIPFNGFSWYDLMIMRFDELRNSEYLIKYKSKE